jgi:hypothetical protein
MRAASVSPVRPLLAAFRLGVYDVRPWLAYFHCRPFIAAAELKGAAGT